MSDETESDPILQQVVAEVVRSAGTTLDEIPEAMRSRLIRNVLARMSALANNQPETANLFSTTIALDLATVKKIGSREARQLILRITKIAARAAVLIPGFVGVAIGALSALIPEPKETDHE